MLCAISQTIPEEPVLSAVSGCVFEKKLIQKYISEFKRDPVTNDPLDEDQLIAIKPASKIVNSKPPALTSIPDILGQLRDEYDSCMLDSFELKQQLMTTRQELSHALYQLDASYRVIASLKQRIDEMKSKLED